MTTDTITADQTWTAPAGGVVGGTAEIRAKAAPGAAVGGTTLRGGGGGGAGAYCEDLAVPIVAGRAYDAKATKGADAGLYYLGVALIECKKGGSGSGLTGGVGGVGGDCTPPGTDGGAGGDGVLAGNGGGGGGCGTGTGGGDTAVLEVGANDGTGSPSGGNGGAGHDIDGSAGVAPTGAPGGGSYSLAGTTSPGAQPNGWLEITYTAIVVVTGRSRAIARRKSPRRKIASPRRRMTFRGIARS